MLKALLGKQTLVIGVAFIVVLLLSLVLQHAWPLLVFTVVILAIFLQLPTKLSDSLALRILLSVMIVMAAIQLEAVAGYVLRLDLNSFIYNITNALLVIFLPLFAPRPRKLRWTLDDSWTFLVPALVVGGLLFSVLSLVTTRDATINDAVIHKITTTSDESNHLNMFAQSIHTDGDMTISPKIYPTGWHVATAVVVSSFVDITDKPYMSTATAYYGMKLFGVFLAVMSIMILLIALAKQVLKNRGAYYLLFGLVTLFLTLVAIIPNSEINGFYNFIPQYAYFLLAFTLLLHAKNNLKLTIPILVVFALSSFVSWIISGILLMGIVTVSILAPFISKKDKLKNPLSATVLQIALLGIVLVGVLLVSLPGGFIGNIIDTLEHPEGWIEGYSLVAYSVTFLLLVVCGLFASKNSLPLQYRAALTSFFVVVGLVFTVTALRGYGGDQLSYYWQKMLFPLLLIAVPTLVVLTIKKAGQTMKHVAAVYVVILVSITLLATNVIGYRPFDLSLRVIGNQTFLHKTQNLNITKSLVALFENNTFKSETADRYVYITSPNYTLDQMVYQLMSRSITDNSLDALGNSCLPAQNSNGGFYGDNMILLKDIKSEYCGHKVKIVVSNDTIDSVRKYKSEEELVNVDTDL